MVIIYKVLEYATKQRKQFPCLPHKILSARESSSSIPALSDSLHTTSPCQDTSECCLPAVATNSTPAVARSSSAVSWNSPTTSANSSLTSPSLPGYHSVPSLTIHTFLPAAPGARLFSIEAPLSGPCHPLSRETGRSSPAREIIHKPTKVIYFPPKICDLVTKQAKLVIFRQAFMIT